MTSYKEFCTKNGFSDTKNNKESQNRLYYSCINFLKKLKKIQNVLTKKRKKYIRMLNCFKNLDIESSLII